MFGIKRDQSIHLQTFPEISDAWCDNDIGSKWEKIREVRRVVLGALEIERAEKRIGSSLQAAPTVYMSEAHAAAFEGVDLAEITITSDAVIKTSPAPENSFTIAELPGLAVVPMKAIGHKCERCWKVLPEVGSNKEFGDICNRCVDAVRGYQAAAE